MTRIAGSARPIGILVSILLAAAASTPSAFAAPPQFLYENDFVGKWGSSGSGDDQFTQPAGIAQDSAGNVFVVDISNSRIQKFDPSGQFLSKFGSVGGGDGQFFSPHGVAINNSDEIYVADSTLNRVQQFDADGLFIRTWGTGGANDGELQNPRSLAVAPNGNVYVADYSNDRIQIFQPDGTFVRTFGTTGSNDGELSFPDGIAVDGGGNVYVVDAGNNRVQVFNASDTFVRKWGSIGTGDGQFDFPTGLALGADGIVYVADFNNDRVQAFTTEGAFLGKWGTAGNDDGEFQGPRGVMVTAAGRVYVSNSDMGVGNRVQFFEPIWNVTMDEDGTPTPFSLTLQGTDGDMDTITWSISGLAAHGTAGASGTGTSKVITYTPTPDYTGEDSFEVQIDDGNAGTATRTVNVVLDPINDAPVIDQGVGPLSVSMSADGNPDPFVAPVLTAIDPDGDTILWSVSSVATHGLATVSGSGLMPPTFTYAPMGGYMGMDSFTVRCSDGILEDTIVVNVTISTPSEPPVIDQGAGPLSVSMNEDGVFTAPTLSATDADTAPGSLTWSIFAPATFGTTDVSGTGATPSTFTYEPATDFSGSVSFTVQVSDGVSTDTIDINVTVNAVNDAPVIFQGAGPLAVTMSEDSDPTDFERPTLYATDVDGDTLTWSVASPAGHGTATVSGTGSSAGVLDYVPAADYTGNDTFTVQVSDGTLSDTIVINVTIEPVNDGPSIDQGAGPLVVEMDEDGTFAVPVLTATDVDTAAGSLTWSVTAPAAHGTASVSGSGDAPAIFTYAPEDDFFGSDSFTVEVSDGSLIDMIVIAVTVRSVNDDPSIASTGTTITMNEDGASPDFSVLSISASDLEGPSGDFAWSVSAQGTKGTAGVTPAGASPLIVYVPKLNENGLDSFTLAVSDGDGGVAEITLSVTITPQPDAPIIAQGDSATGTYTRQGSASGFSPPTIAAIDPDGGALTWSLLTQAIHGTAEVSGTGTSPATLDYTPEVDYLGADSFVVAVVDDDDSMATITINVNVIERNDAPSIVEGAGPLVVAMSEDGTFLAPALSALDSDDDPLTWSVSMAAASGVATVDGTGVSPETFSYLPEADYSGTDRFTVEVSDGRGGTDSIEIVLSIAAVNDFPVITQGDEALEVTMDEDGDPVPFLAPELSATDVDADLSALSWSIAEAATHGTATATGSGASPETVTYTPEDNFAGEDAFVVAVTDDAEGVDLIQVRVTVSPRNDAPTITQGDEVAVTMDEDGSPTAFAAPEITAVDPDEDALTWSLVTPPNHGAATASGDGSSPALTYVPVANYFGEDAFTVRVTDTTEFFDEITINVTVTSIIDPIVIVQGDSVMVTMDEDGSPTAFAAPELAVASVDLALDNVTWSLAAEPAHGTAEVSGTGATPEVLSYVPTRDFNGMDQFTVQVSDGAGPVDEIVIEVTLAAVNDAPRFDSLLGHQFIGGWDIPLLESESQLDRLSLAIGPEGNVYVGENTHIRVYSPEGEFIRDFTQFSADSLGVDSSGAVYASFLAFPIIAKFSAGGTLDFGWLTATDLFPLNQTHQITSISAAPDGAVQFMQLSRPSGGGDPTIQLRGLNAAGGLQYSADQPLARDNRSAPGNLIVGQGVNFEYIAATDGLGNSYAWRQYVRVTFSTPYFYKHRLEELHIYDPQGKELRKLEVPGILTGAKRRLAVRPDGQRIYTSDDLRGKVDVQTADGTFLLPFGGLGTEEGRFETVSGLAVNSDGRIYVSDQISKRIQYFEEIEADQEVTVFMSEDGGFRFPYAASDPEDDPITWTIISGPETGTATGGETLGYTPPLNYHGSASFEAAVEDDSGASTSIVVHVIVESADDSPIITEGDADIQVTMTENGTPMAFTAPTLSATDADIATDGDSLTWSALNNVQFDVGGRVYYEATHGTASASGAGASPSTITYAPPQDFSGTDAFTVVVTDTKGRTDRVVIRIIISAATEVSTTAELADLLEEDFENTDVNGDGMLSRLEVGQRFPQITDEQFDEIDTDGDGFLSLEEIQNVEDPPPPLTCNDPGAAKAFADTAIGHLVEAIREGLTRLWNF